jgi:hypothetical protein
VGVAIGRIDEGDAQIQQAVEKGFNPFEGSAIANASSTESMATDLEVGRAESDKRFQ